MVFSKLRPQSIKDKIRSISILQIILPIIIIGILSFVISNNIIRNQALLRTKQTFNYVSEQVTAYTDAISGNAPKILYDRDVYETIAFGLPIDDKTSESIHNLLQQMVTSDTNIEAVSFTIRDENFRTVSKKINIPSAQSVGYSDILKKARKNENSVYWYTDMDGENSGSIYVAKILYNPYTYEEIGNIVFQASGVSLMNMISKYNTSSDSKIDIISNNDRYIYKADPTVRDDELYELSFNENELIKHNNSYLIYHTIPSVNWRILCTLSSKSLFETSVWLMLCIFLLCLISATALVLFTKYINNNISSPLSELAKQIQTWDEDKVFRSPYKHRKDEIGVLYNSFSLMTRRIGLLIKQNYRNKLLQKDIELKMLQSQITPHFMFNALSAINNMAILNNMDDISKMVTALSDTLNNRISRNGRYVTLNDELSASDSYIYIQQVRFSNRLEIEKNISENARNIPIPNLTIQPIVENAVKYGLEATDRKCIIKINAYIDDDDLIVTVSDNGTGIEKDRLERINTALKNDALSIDGSIGLVNVNKRLMLLYGNDYGITIDSEPNKFTTVTLKYKIQDVKQY